MKKITVLLVLLAFSVTQALHAQKQITGTVTSSEDGSTLPGVTVMVKGTTTGGVTNLDGIYQLSVPDDATVLVFSFVGMKDMEIPIEGRSVIDVAMEPEVTELETVVVVGYGVRSKNAITGSVGVVKVEKVESAPSPSVDKILQGNVAGVQVATTSGAPGAFTSVRIRGQGSINAGVEPLYIVDGVQINTGDLSYHTTSENALNSLNPNDIASISVLKDASASAIYGSRAANGVILITTKSGETGKTKINIRTQHGFTTLSDKDYQMCNSRELLTLQREALENAGLNWQSATVDGEPNPYYRPDSLANIDTDWWDLVTRKGYYQKYEVSAAGGDEKTKFFTSAEYMSTKGAIKPSKLERLSTRINLTHKFNDKLTFENKLAPSYTQRRYHYESFAYESPILGAQTISPMKPPFNEDGSINWDVPENGGANPVGLAMLDRKTNNVVRLINYTSMEYDFLPSFKYKAQASIDFNHIQEKDWRSPQGPYGLSDPTRVAVTRNILWTATHMLSYNKIFNEVHSIDAILGNEVLAYRRYHVRCGGLGTNDFNPFLNAVSSAQYVDETLREYSQLSYFSRVAYNYNGKYYLNASFRRDANSKFGANNRWGTFYSVGSRWRINRESFMDGIAFIDELTIRGSYGTTGNDKLVDSNNSLNYYGSLELYSSTSYNNTSALTANQLANPNLSWEKSSTFNIALEFGLFKRINGTVEYYNKKTTDLLMNVPLSPTTGFRDIIKNLGSIRNTGLELLLSSENFKGEFKWNTTINLTIPKNEVLELAGQDSMIYQAPYRTRIRIIGESVSQFYLYDFIGANPATGNPMWYDDNGNVTFLQQEARSVAIGDPYPDIQGSFTNTFSYKGVELSAMLYFVTGLYTMHQYRRYMEDDFQGPNSNKGRVLLNRWQNPGDITDVPKQIHNNTTNGGSYGNSRLVTRGDFLRLRDVSLSYNLPESITSKIKVQSIKVFARGTNLWTLHNSPAMDPEVGNNRRYEGISIGAHPNTKTITFGLDIGL